MKYLPNEHTKDFEEQVELFVLVPYKKKTNEKLIITILALTILLVGLGLYLLSGR